MTPALITTSFATSLLVFWLAWKLFVQNTFERIEKLAVMVFLLLFLFQILLLGIQLASWSTLLPDIRPYLAALIAPSGFWALSVLVRNEYKLNIIDLFHLLPFILNSFHLVPFDYALSGTQMFYSILMFNLVFDKRLNKRGALKITTLLLALLFTASAVSELLIAFEIQQGGQISESITLFILLFTMYSALVFVTTVGQVNPSVLHRVISDVQFTVNKTLTKKDAMVSTEISHQFRKIEEEIKTHEYYLEEDFDLGYLSSCLNLSTRELSNIINRGARKNFSAYINDLKIEKAKNLLRDNSHSKLNVTQVMFEAGFTTKSSFNREFAIRANTTPSQYRKSAAKAKVQ